MGLLGVVLSAVALIPQSATLQTTVHYSNPGAQARCVLADLAKETGVALEASPQTINEVLSVRLDNVSLEDAMDRIAWAVDGAWKKVGSGYRLVRTGEQQREEERLFRESVARKYRALLGARQAALTSMPVFGPGDASKLAGELETVLKSFNPEDHRSDVWQRGRALDRKGPAGRALDRMAQLCDPYELADMPARIKVVYSSNPTATQRPLGAKGLEIVRQYIQEQGVWAAEATRRRIRNPQVGESTFWLGGLSGNTEPVSDELGKVLFMVTKSDVDQPPQFQLLVANSKGKIISDCHGGLGEAVSPLPLVPAKLATDPVVTIKVPPSLAELQHVWITRNASPLEGRLREKILSPEKFEPLGLSSGALLLAVAEFKKLSMVVDLCDDTVMTTGISAEVVPDAFLTTLTNHFLDRDPAEGWLLMRPKWPCRARQLQIDRSAFGVYLRKLATNGRVTLDERAEFVKHCPEDAHNMIQQIAEAIIVGPKSEYQDENVLRFYGALNLQQRLSAQRGALTYGSLTPYQVHVVQKMLYRQDANLQFDPASPDGNSEQSRFELYNEGLLREVTEALPNGPSSSTRIRLTSSESEVALCERGGGGPLRSSAENLTAEDFAFRRFAQEKPGLFPWIAKADDRFNLDQVRFGIRTTVEVTFQFTPELALQASVQTSDLRGGDAVAYRALPESFRNDVEQRIARLSKAYANAKSGDSVSRLGFILPPY